MSRLTVGLTGGLASGKSTVAALLREAGCTVVDADGLVADSYRAGQPGAAVVERLLGAEALTPDGAVDHRRVAERIFADPQARTALERAIHPLVRAGFRAVAEAVEGVVVLEATVTVEAGPELRVGRAVARGMSEADARARIASQGSEAARRAAADVVLDNNGDPDALRQQTEALLDRLRAEPDTDGADA